MVRLELTEGLIQKLKSRKDLIYSTILKQNLILTQTGSSPADLTKNILEGELSPVLEDAERESIDELFRRIDIQNLSGRSKEYHGDERLRKDESDEELSSENEEAIDWIDHRTILKVVKILRASSNSSEQSKKFKETLSSIKLSLDKLTYERMVSTDSSIRQNRLLTLGKTHTFDDEDRLRERRDSRVMVRSISLITNMMFSALGFSFSVGWLMVKSYEFKLEIGLIVGLFSGYLSS
ncbi:hypothetical protein PPACK8108_LOCUS22085 [Phakopsora pachyrhizi]|uniref:Uncharacterized protein n=1 Tax=Phakopsora pachyrhizi TaxID=170000 RepID=A0AAV0BJY8_PHAPC|nr:hypothetical protein PPACK8108_LOCUS22085 [Phakopsora pachyrhizi]